MSPKPNSYVTHARNPEELRKEVVSDLHRRIDSLGRQEEYVAKSKAEKAKMERAVAELRDMLTYWTDIQILRTPRKASLTLAAPVQSLAEHHD